MTIGIYKIINNLNNKIYIGQSIHIEQRISEHKSESLYGSPDRLAYNSVIHKAIRKYGWDNFSWEIIEECSIPQLDDKEKYWIAYFNSLVPNGYNILIGGQVYRKNNDNTDSDTKKDKCPICGKEKYKQAAFCLNCYHQQQTADTIARIQEINEFDFKIEFNKSRIFNETEKVNTLNNDTILSTKTKLEKHPYCDDVDVELQRIAEEKRENMKMQSQIFNNSGGFEPHNNDDDTNKE